VTIRVLDAGMLTTVQDLGRADHQHEGIPAGGAMDRFALRAANIIIGNDAGDAALEMTMTGATLRFERDALVALAGADLGAHVGDVAVAPWRPTWIAAGATLAMGAARAGARAYLAIAGGIDVPRVLGSRSTLARARLGGHEGRALARGDVLPIGALSPLARRIASMLARAEPPANVARWAVGFSLRPRYDAHAVVRITPGAHVGALSREGRERLFGESFRVSPQSDRMGYRLECQPLALDAPLELLSEAVAFGTVQLPPNGEPIVLMAERQTTGGYPRVGEVATVDLPLVAQLRPGDRVRFRPVSLERAEALYVARELDLITMRRAVELIAPS
jgi:antagonist of KipI